MGSAWAFAVLILYPAVQVPLLWVVVRHYGLRNDDGPRDPVGYGSRIREDAGGSGERESAAGRCHSCGRQNDPVAEYCRHCLSGLSSRPR